MFYKILIKEGYKMGKRFAENTILIASSSKVLVSRIEYVMNLAGFKKCYFAEDGEDILEIAKNNRIDIFLMETKLKNKNGFQVMEELLEYNPKSKIILMGSDEKKLIKNYSIVKGAKYYLLKPFEEMEVIIIIDEVLNSGLRMEISSEDYEALVNTTISMDDFTKHETKDSLEEYIKNIGEIMLVLKDSLDNLGIYDMLRDNIDSVLEHELSEGTRENLTILRENIVMLEDGVVEYDNQFFESCIYLLNDIRKGLR